MLANSNLLKILQKAPPAPLPAPQRLLLKDFVENPKFAPENLKKKSAPCEDIAVYIRARYFYQQDGVDGANLVHDLVPPG